MIVRKANKDKAIKDYVAIMVKEIYSEPTEEEKTYFALKKAINAEIDRLNEKFKPMIEEEIKAFNTIHGLDKRTGGIRLRDSYICIYDSYDLESNTEIGQKALEARRARRIKINEAIENIILTLELGGNKADLDRMLNELKENK